MAKRKLPQIQESNFVEAINKSIKKGQHVDQLKEFLLDYEKYQKVFSDVFSDKNPLNAIYIFRVTLLCDRPVWRDIAISGKDTFCDLADTIIEWMDWDNDHMHAFSLKKVAGVNQNRYTQYSFYAPGWEDDPHPTYKTDEIKIANLDYEKHPKLNFVFDFGDGHEFDIELKKIDEKSKAKDFREPLPTCIDQRGVAPIQYPDYEGDSEYEDDSEEHILDDNCPLCQELKKSDSELTWGPDEPKKAD